MTIQVSESEEMYNEKLIELKQQEQEFLQKIENTQREIQAEENAGIPHVGTYNGLKNKLDNSKVRLAEIQQQISEMEGAAETAQNEVASEFDDVGGTGLPLRALASSEEAYQIISIFLQQKIGHAAEQHAAVVHSYKSEVAMLSETINELYKVKDEVEVLQQENDSLHRENLNLGEQLTDMTNKREAAATELEVVKSENARLKEDNSKLREQLENKNTTRDTGADIKAFAEKIKASMKPIFNVRWKNELRKTHYLATLAETGEEIEIPHYAINSYRQLEGEELARFQEELEAKRAAAEVEDPIQLAPSLPIPQPHAQVSTNSLPGEVAPEATEVTRAEFEALANRVSALESMRNIA